MVGEHSSDGGQEEESTEHVVCLPSLPSLPSFMLVPAGWHNRSWPYSLPLRYEKQVHISHNLRQDNGKALRNDLAGTSGHWLQ